MFYLKLYRRDEREIGRKNRDGESDKEILFKKAERGRKGEREERQRNRERIA